MAYKRILLKLSGEALMGDRQHGIDPKRLADYAQEIKNIVDQGIEVVYVNPTTNKLHLNSPLNSTSLANITIISDRTEIPHY